MSKLIYLSGGWNDHEEIISYAEKLTPHGFDIAHDWPWQARLQAAKDAAAGADHILRGDSHLSETERWRHASEEIGAILKCDVFWLLVASYKGSAGSWFEYGYAVSLADQIMLAGKDRRPRIFVSGENARKSIFTSIDGVRLYATHAQAYGAIIAS